MMTVHLIANILILCYRVLNYGNGLTPGNFVFYSLSIDVVLVAIAISNYQTLMIFSVLDSKLTQYKKVLVAILVIVSIVFGVKMALLIIDAFQLLNYTYTFDVGKALTFLVVSQDNLQNFYLTFLIYNSLHHKTHENKNDNDFCFNFIAIHTISMTGLFHQFKTLAMIKITSRIKALEKHNIEHQVKYDQELPTILLAQLPVEKIVLQKPKSVKTRGRSKTQRSVNSTLNSSAGLSAILERKSKQVSFSF
ncbi:hypothetical protein HDV04_001299 [Boothiomyces sp. JEL0838]|nr:hypothetical protein HDV04_001299 [Boothiomyces sp. JEL0838]